MPLGLLDGSELVHLVDVGLVAPVHGQQLQGPSLLASVPVGLVRIVEEVHVVPGTEAVLLDRVRLGGIDGHLEVGVVHGDEVAPSALGAVVLDHHGLVDLPGVRYETGHGHPGAGDPLPLHVPVGLPVQDRAVAVRGDLHVGEPAGPHVLHEGAVGDDDDVPVQQLPGAVVEVVEVLVPQDLVGLGQGERVVVLRAVGYGEPKGLEAHLPRAVEDLQGRVGAQRGDCDVAGVVPVQNLFDLALGNHIQGLRSYL